MLKIGQNVWRVGEKDEPQDRTNGNDDVQQQGALPGKGVSEICEPKGNPCQEQIPHQRQIPYRIGVLHAGGYQRDAKHRSRREQYKDGQSISAARKSVGYVFQQGHFRNPIKNRVDRPAES